MSTQMIARISCESVMSALLIFGKQPESICYYFPSSPRTRVLSVDPESTMEN